MKRSNIALLALVGSSVIFIAAIPVLYSAEIVKAREATASSRYSTHRFPHAKVVKLTGMQNVVVVPSDTLTIAFKESLKGNSEFTMTGDTLAITGDGHLIVSVDSQAVVAINSRVLLKGDNLRLDPPSLSFFLTDSHVYSQPISRDKRAPQHLNEFRIEDTGKSVIDLQGRFDIEHLFLHNVERFSISSDVGLRETDFSFDDGREIKTMTCREGLYIYH